MKLGAKVEHGPGKNTSNFGADPVAGADPGILKVNYLSIVLKFFNSCTY